MIDLHTHSTASDGSDSPAELVEKACSKKIEALALTDHDTVNGLAKAREAARDLGLLFIPGCEISTNSEMGEVHILGLWIPEKCDSLVDFLNDIHEKRASRNENMVAKLKALGYNITMDEVLEKAGSNPGRPHIAAILVEKGYAPDNDTAFQELIGETGRAYVPKYAPPPSRAIKILGECGASAVMAHPMLKSWPHAWLEKFIGDLAARGLFGLEAWHSAHSPRDARIVLELAKKFNLNVSGGSDYHGTTKPDIELGMGRGNLNIPMDVFEKLVKGRKSMGLPC